MKHLLHRELSLKISLNKVNKWGVMTRTLSHFLLSSIKVPTTSLATICFQMLQINYTDWQALSLIAISRVAVSKLSSQSSRAQKAWLGSREVLSYRSFCSDGNGLYLCYPTWSSGSCAHCALSMWLVPLGNRIFNFN